MAPALPIYNDRDSACPAGSSGKMLHLLCELAKNSADVLLQRTSPFMAPLSPQSMSAPRPLPGVIQDIARIWSNDQV